MDVFAQMKGAAEGAAPDRLGEVAAAMWKAYGAGGLTDEQAEQLDALLQARQGAAAAAPSRAQRPALEPALAALARAPGKGRAGTKPRTGESLARRRRWAAAGYLPPAIACAFTPAEQAVLAVVAAEVGKRGSCTFAHGHVAALAGTCATIVKRALRLARTLGLITVEERRVARRRNDTNVVRLASREWAAWLRLRLPRSALAAPGGISAAGTCTGREKGRVGGLRTGGQRPGKAVNYADRLREFPGRAG